MLTRVLRRMPPPVLAYLVLTTATIAWGFSRSSKLWNHPAKAAIVVMLLVFWQLGLVIKRWRWAWALALIIAGITVLSPMWESITVVSYIYSVVIVGLLLSPEMRRYVGVDRQRPPEVSTWPRWPPG